MARIPQRELREVNGIPVLEININQDYETFYSSLPEPDPDWTYTDAAGHDHYRDGNMLPSLVWSVDEIYWCGMCHDEHEEGHYECPRCGEHVVPGIKMPSPFGTTVATLRHTDLVLAGDAGDEFVSNITGERMHYIKVGVEASSDEIPRVTYAGVGNGST